MVCNAGVAVTVGVGLTVTFVLDMASQPLTSVTFIVYVPEADVRALGITGF